MEKKETLLQLLTLPAPTIRYIDLFCGIGGFHQAIQNSILHASCVLASDIDANARKMYEINHSFGPCCDIKKSIFITKLFEFCNEVYIQYTNMCICLVGIGKHLLRFTSAGDKSLQTLLYCCMAQQYIPFEDLVSKGVDSILCEVIVILRPPTLSL